MTALPARLAALGDAADLAVRASVAARVDRALLRELRLGLPALDATAESDLWFSPLVSRRTAHELVFATDALDELRARAAGAPWLPSVRRAILAVHAAPPPLLALEEELVYLALTGAAPAAIDALLASAWRTLREDAARAPDVAAWALSSIPRLPRAVRDRGAAWSLVWEAMAQSRASIELAGDVPADVMSPPAKISVGVARDAATLSLGAGGAAIAIPDTRPRILFVSIDGVTQRHELPLSLPVSAASTVELATLAGDRWRVSVAAAAAPEPEAEESGLWIFVDGDTTPEPAGERRAFELGRAIALAGASLITLGTLGVAAACARGMWSVLAQQGYVSGIYRMSHVLLPGAIAVVEHGRRITVTDPVRFAVAAADQVYVLGASPSGEEIAAHAHAVQQLEAADAEIQIPRLVTTSRDPARIAAAARALDDPQRTPQGLLDALPGASIASIASPGTVEARPAARLVAYHALHDTVTPAMLAGALQDLLLAERATVREQQETRLAEIAVGLVAGVAPHLPPADRDTLATRCQILRLDARGIPDDELASRIARLGDHDWMRRAWLIADRAIAYEAARALRVGSDARLRELSGIVSEIQSIRTTTLPEIELWFGAGHAGARIAAIALVAHEPDPRALAIVTSALREPASPFEHYWALRAAQAIVPSLDASAREPLRECVEAIRRTNPLTMLADDARKRLFDELDDELDHADRASPA